MRNSFNIFINVISSKVARKAADAIISPFTLISALWFRYIRARDVNTMPLSKRIFNKVGVFPINDHYYEPLFNTSKHLTKPLTSERNLPGIDMNADYQCQLVSSFSFQKELMSIPLHTNEELTYYYDNPSYPAGDAEILYNIIRQFKPKRIIEIGCGFSTLMMRNAIVKNNSEGVSADHICIEPYEMSWLEKLGITVLREKVENIPLEFFRSLEENDILFIDSSHMVRPQGDVLFEVLEVIPILQPGVLVHIHDIFTPRDYPDYWVKELNRFWNEQYLLEAYLSNNQSYKIILAANFLWHSHESLLMEKCPMLSQLRAKEPCSIWLQKQ